MHPLLRMSCGAVAGTIGFFLEIIIKIFLFVNNAIYYHLN